jgi:hypothetical protein
MRLGGLQSPSGRVQKISRTPGFYFSCILTFCFSLTTHNTNIHALGGIGTRNPNKRKTADPRLRLLGYWDCYRWYNFYCGVHNTTSVGVWYLISQGLLSCDIATTLTADIYLCLLTEYSTVTLQLSCYTVTSRAHCTLKLIARTKQVNSDCNTTQYPLTQTTYKTQAQQHTAQNFSPGCVPPRPPFFSFFLSPNELLPYSAVQFLILWVKQSRLLLILDSWQMASCLLPCTAIPLHHVASFN